jgi:hypothetical protein
MARSGLPRRSLSIADEAVHSRTAFLDDDWSGSLCLFEYRRPLPAAQVQAAIQRLKTDKPYLTEPQPSFDPPEVTGPPALEALSRLVKLR